MKVAVTGSARGQLHAALLNDVPEGIDARALVGPDGRRLDVSDRDAVLRACDAMRPDAIVNAAAFTGVDLAETEVAKARAINAEAPAHLAEAACALDAHLVQVSTDFVFPGTGGTPLDEEAETAPLGVYGRTKRDGELAALEGAPGAAVVRTAWVHSSHGSNFVRTILRLLSERESLGIVADQFGTPTRAESLAAAVWRAVERRTDGVLHWTDAGAASWYDFAVAIAEEGAARGLVPPHRHVRPIPASDYPTPAARPGFAVLCTRLTRERLGLEPGHWRDGLRTTLDELAATAAHRPGDIS